MAKKELSPKESMPAYAESNAFVVSGEQLYKIMRGRNPFRKDIRRYDRIAKRAAYRIARLKDGTWWVENFRAGAPPFAPDYWWPIPNSAGKRAALLKKFIEDNL